VRKQSRNVAGAVAIALLLVASSVVAGCGCTEIHKNIVELRQLHAAYRSGTTPKPDVDAAKIEKLADKLDQVLTNLEELTK